ncbi:hypothetical protein [Microcystis phage Mwe-JY05]
MNREYVVAMFTMGSFRQFVTDPGPLDEAKAFVADPPEYSRPRPQDSLQIFELTTVEEESW